MTKTKTRDGVPVDSTVERSQSPARVVVTNPVVGICHMQVCALADATDEEILATCNHENPSGTTGGWCRVVRGAEQEPSENCWPVTCNACPERKHFLVSC